MLKHLISTGAFDDIEADVTVENVTDDDTEEYLKSLISNEIDEVDLAQLRKAMKECKFTVHIADYAA